MTLVDPLLIKTKSKWPIDIYQTLFSKNSPLKKIQFLPFSNEVNKNFIIHNYEGCI